VSVVGLQCSQKLAVKQVLLASGNCSVDDRGQFDARGLAGGYNHFLAGAVNLAVTNHFCVERVVIHATHCQSWGGEHSDRFRRDRRNPIDRHLGIGGNIQGDGSGSRGLVGLLGFWLGFWLGDNLRCRNHNRRSYHGRGFHYWRVGRRVSGRVDRSRADATDAAAVARNRADATDAATVGRSIAGATDAATVGRSIAGATGATAVARSIASTAVTGATSAARVVPSATGAAIAIPGAASATAVFVKEAVTNVPRATGAARVIPGAASAARVIPGATGAAIPGATGTARVDDAAAGR